MLDLGLIYRLLSTRSTIQYIVLTFLVVCTSHIFAQENEPLELTKIYFEGLQKNDPQYISNLLKYNSGRKVSLSDIKSDVQLLRNTSGISNAQFTIDTTANKISVTYNIEERQTLLPIVSFGGIQNNVWFRLGMTDNNWRGRGHTLLAYYQNNDNRHSGTLYFRNPRILNRPWGYTLNLNKWSSLEPLYFDEGEVQYIYDNNGIGATLIRNLGLRRYVELGSTYFVEKYQQSEEQSLSNPPGPQSLVEKKWLFKIIFNQDYLNYNFFYLKGYDFNFTFQKVINSTDKSIFNSLQFQSKYFLRPNKKLNLAARFKFGISTNNETPFAPFVVDSHVNIRGVGNRIDRGTAQLILNTELRYTIYHEKKWASQLVTFSDLGTWRNPGGTVSQLFDRAQFRQFVGLGFRVIFQKVFGATFRLDYGVDIYNSSERGFVIGLGQYF